MALSSSCGGDSNGIVSSLPEREDYWLVGCLNVSQLGEITLPMSILDGHRLTLVIVIAAALGRAFIVAAHDRVEKPRRTRMTQLRRCS